MIFFVKYPKDMLLHSFLRQKFLKKGKSIPKLSLAKEESIGYWNSSDRLNVEYNFESRNFPSILFERSHSKIKVDRLDLVDTKKNKKSKYLVKNWKRWEKT